MGMPPISEITAPSMTCSLGVRLMVDIVKFEFLMLESSCSRVSKYCIMENRDINSKKYCIGDINYLLVVTSKGVYLKENSLEQSSRMWMLKSLKVLQRRRGWRLTRLRLRIYRRLQSR
jgi:hypothetical protein